MSEPGYWMAETSGVLRPAVEAYLGGGPMTGEDIAAVRAYIRQWIMSEVWDENPHATRDDRAWLAMIREAVDQLTGREAIACWLAEAAKGGIEPL